MTAPLSLTVTSHTEVVPQVGIRPVANWLLSCAAAPGAAARREATMRSEARTTEEVEEAEEAEEAEEEAEEDKLRRSRRAG